MKESFWAILVVTMGIISIAFIYFFQSATSTDEQNYTLLKETTEAAMYDAVDCAEYRKSGNVRINREKFVENFIRRFAESASLSNTYHVSEMPPKVSLKVSTKLKENVTSENVEFDITNRLDAILETPY